MPFAIPQNEREQALGRALKFFKKTKGNVSSLAKCLGCSKRTAERIVAELKGKGVLARQGSARSGSWIVFEDNGY